MKAYLHTVTDDQTVSNYVSKWGQNHWYMYIFIRAEVNPKYNLMSSIIKPICLSECTVKMCNFITH